MRDSLPPRPVRPLRTVGRRYRPRRASSPAHAPRVVFALGYYSGIAAKKDNGAFGYMLGFFPLYGLCWLWFLTELKLL